MHARPSTCPAAPIPLHPCTALLPQVYRKYPSYLLPSALNLSCRLQFLADSGRLPYLVHSRVEAVRAWRRQAAATGDPGAAVGVGRRRLAEERRLGRLERLERLESLEQERRSVVPAVAPALLAAGRHALLPAAAHQQEPQQQQEEDDEDSDEEFASPLAQTRRHQRWDAPGRVPPFLTISNVVKQASGRVGFIRT